jgi:hypothetical protein
MGSEFLNRTKKTIVKHLDAKRAELARRTLLTLQPKNQPRSSIASLDAGAIVAGGETLIVEYRSGSLKLRRGNAFVGTLDNPAPDIVSAVEKSGGAANGVIQRVHVLSRKVDVSLC